MMMANARAVATVAVTDLKEGKRFYSKNVGLEEVKGSVPQLPGHTFLRCGDSYVCLYERPTPANSQATVFSISVEDVEETVHKLRKTGVRFEDYDIPEMKIKTKGGIASSGGFQTAWFTDPWGNVVAIDNGLQLLNRSRMPRPQTA